MSKQSCALIARSFRIWNMRRTCIDDFDERLLKHSFSLIYKSCMDMKLKKSTKLIFFSYIYFLIIIKRLQHLNDHLMFAHQQTNV